jgi:hypothetical protein
MTTAVPSNKMQTTGHILSWLTGSAAVGMVLVLACFFHSYRSPGAQADGLLTRLAVGIGPYLGFIIVITLVSEASAFVVFVVGAACWRLRIVRSPRWVLSGLGIVLVAAAMYLVVYVAIVIAISPV